MNHRERISAAMRGEPVDHTPVALWRHFPNDDLSAEGLARRVVEFQNKYEFDLVKVTPASGYPAEMYGATFRDGQNREGTRTYVSRPVNSISDWNRIGALDASNPVFQREAAAIKLIRQALGAEVPILQTVFAPLNTAHNLAGERLMEDLRAEPVLLHRVLRALTETTIRFATESLRAGASAIFFATQMATPKYLTLEEFQRFGEPYDLEVVEALTAAQAEFILLHIHGLNIYFEPLSQWPVQAINWHDRRTEPSLAEARAQYRGLLVGGIDEWGTLQGNPADREANNAIVQQVRNAIEQVNGRGLILAGGCVIPIDTPEQNIRTVLETAGAAK